MNSKHRQYLLKFYQKKAEALLKGKLTDQQFAKLQTRIHLKLEKRADYDGLIDNFLNNNGFTKALEQNLQTMKRTNNLKGVLLALDIDRLKKFNDLNGHPAGDKLIKTYAQVITQHIRRADLKARLGGDEFAVFLLGSDIKGAKVVAERIRLGIIKAVKQVFPDLKYQQTISIGIATLGENEGVLSLRQRADQALYQAKKTRNLVVIE